MYTKISIVCCVCNKECKTRRGLSKHIKSIHHISNKNYYDQFLKKENEGLCLICDRQTIFRENRWMYPEYCTSAKCWNNSKKVQERKVDSCMMHYGVKNPSQSKTIKVKKEITNINTCGFKYPLQSPQNQVKFKSTCSINFGTENPMHSEEIKEKAKQTCLDHFGTTNWAKSEEGRKFHRDRIDLQKFFEGGGMCVSILGRDCLDILEITINCKILREQKKFNYFLDGTIENIKMAIEFDGRHNFKDKYLTLTDHDIEKQKKIESLGYVFFRIKQINWLSDPEKEIDRFKIFVSVLSEQNQKDITNVI